jgi:hypothetical protein
MFAILFSASAYPNPHPAIEWADAPNQGVAVPARRERAMRQFESQTLVFLLK